MGPVERMVRPHRLYIGPAGVNEPRLCAIPTSMAVFASSVKSQPEKNVFQCVCVRLDVDLSTASVLKSSIFRPSTIV